MTIKNVFLFSNSAGFFVFCSVVLLVNGKQTTVREQKNVDTAIYSFAFNLFYFSKTGIFFKNPRIARPDKSTCYQRIIMHIFTTINMKITNAHNY